MDLSPAAAKDADRSESRKEQEDGSWFRDGGLTADRVSDVKAPGVVIVVSRGTHKWNTAKLIRICKAELEVGRTVRDEELLLRTGTGAR